MAVRRLRLDATGSATIAAANNAPTGANNNLSTNNAQVLTITEFTTFADKFNLVLAALKDHGIINTA